MLKEADSSGADKKDITWKKLADFVNNSASQTHSSTVYDLANTYYGDFLRYYQEQEMNGFTLIVDENRTMEGFGQLFLPHKFCNQVFFIIPVVPETFL